MIAPPLRQTQRGYIWCPMWGPSLSKLNYVLMARVDQKSLLQWYFELFKWKLLSLWKLNFETVIYTWFLQNFGILWNFLRKLETVWNSVHFYMTVWKKFWTFCVLLKKKKKNLAKTFQNLGIFCGTNSTKPGHLGPIEDLSWLNLVDLIKLISFLLKVVCTNKWSYT